MADEIQIDSSTENSLLDDSINQSDSLLNNHHSNELSNGFKIQNQTNDEQLTDDSINNDQSNLKQTFDNSNIQQQTEDPNNQEQQQTDDSNNQQQTKDPNNQEQQRTDDSNNQQQTKDPNNQEQQQTDDSNNQEQSNNHDLLNNNHSETPIESDHEEELKPQRELDENEIPPVEIPIDQTPVIDSTTDSEPVVDDRPLTQLEDPFGNHQEQFSSIESSPEQINNNSITENEITEENPLKNPTLSSFLPDVVNETIETNSNSETDNQESVLNEKSPSEFTSEDFPPLPRTERPIHQIINDKDFPPLPTRNQDEILHSTSEIEPPIDVLGNKTLFKQTLIKGQPNTRPTRSTMVTISYTLALVDSLTSNSRLIEEIKQEKYFIGENDLIQAIDICVQSMDRGEVCLIESDVRHGYGDHGSEEKHIPSLTTLNPYRMKIQLELHDWTSPLDIQLMPVEERLFWSDKKKNNGNFYYRRQDYKTSLQCYNGASRFVDLNLNPLKYSSDQNQIQILIEKYILIQNNVAQVYLLLNKYEDCLNVVDNVLKLDPKNVKALFRQGKALFELGKYQETIQTLKIFLQIQKGNSNANVDIEKANELIHISENKLANYQKNEREIYQRMFRSTTANNQQQQQQQQQTKTNNPKQTVNSNTNWLPYIALGTAALAVVGYVAFNRYGKLS